jgi:spore maturation protein CgeB
MRLFEATGVGCALLTYCKSVLIDYFLEGKEVLTFKSIQELIEKIKCLLKKPKSDKLLGQNAQNRVLHEHTTDIQTNQLSEIIKYNFGK